MAKRLKKQENRSLDSLLDTMTNVVGILVIVLIVTQLGVADAVKRMLTVQEFADDLPKISSTQLENIRAETEQLKKAVAGLDANVNFLGIGGEDAELIELNNQITTFDEDLKNLETKKDSAELEKLVTERRTELAKLEKEFQKTDKRLSELQALLTRAPKKKKAPPPKVVQVPDPRPAPEGSEPYHFLCRGGKVYPVDIDRMKRLGRSALNTVKLKTRRTAKKRFILLDPKPLVAYFKNNPVGDTFFRLTVEISNYTPRLVLNRRPEAGEDAGQLAAKGSDYQHVLRTIKGKKRYARFRVYGDSFETYIAARRVCDSYDIPAGWEPTGGKHDWVTYFPVRLEVTGKPKPKPRPKPDESEEPKKEPLPKSDID